MKAMLYKAEFGPRIQNGLENDETEEMELKQIQHSGF